MTEEPFPIPTTPENIELAKDFVFRKWKERAAERGDKEPVDLSRSCKFSSMFAQRVFGGVLRGNYDHQYLVGYDGEIIDLNCDAEDVLALDTPHKHDEDFWGNPEHIESMKSCEHRVKNWVQEFTEEIKASPRMGL